jgi:hypothetical protein
VRQFILCLLNVLLLLPECGADQEFKTGQADLADAIEKYANSKSKSLIYSLNPHDARIFEGKLPENSTTNFHRHPVLGAVQILSSQAKTNWLNAFAKGVRESDGAIANCFDPRQGVRVSTSTIACDFVICFECLQVQGYGFAPSGFFTTAASPGAVFNKLLDQHRIRGPE